MKTIELKVPLKDEDIEQLEIGDTVYLTGVIYTSRDMAHLRIAELRKDNQELPVDFEGSVILHAGPVVKKEGDELQLRVIGPTTSIRMEPHAKMVGELGVKVIVGKGGMAEDSLEKFSEYKQVYLQAPPGCAVKLASGVKAIKDVYWLEMGMPEALWVLEAEKFGPLIVTMDCRKNSVYKQVKENAYLIAEKVLAE